MAQFDNRIEVPLAEVAPTMWGLSLREANRRAPLQELPCMVYKHRPSKSAPYMVHMTDLAETIDNARDEARELWRKMNEAA